jgi:hypothetical protein
VLGVAGACLAAAREAAPWSYGRAPTPEDVRAQVDEAIVLARRDRAEALNSSRITAEEQESILVLQAEIDAGRYDDRALFLLGDEVFSHEFGPHDGYGGVVAGPGPKRVHRGVSGGLDNFSCAGCHSVGGVDGAGAVTQSAHLFGDGDHLSTAVARNPPALQGLGLVQALGVEMTADLADLRARAVREARGGQPVSVALLTKGVSFGTVTARPDGTVDASAVVGVDPDLVVRPFGWKGDEARLRRMVEEAARVHFGAQSSVLGEKYRDEPDIARLGPGPDWWDPDGDGHQREIEEGAITATASYLAMLEAPVVVPPNAPDLLERWGRGDREFDALGCAACHVRTLHLADRFWNERGDTTDGPPVRINLLSDGEMPKGTDNVALFSDLKRHDLGPALADAVDNPAGIARDAFLTRPLWGVAESGPYLHDGRAPTLRDAIRLHGGEAQAAADAFAALDPGSQADLVVFLSSLSRQPKVQEAK